MRDFDYIAPESLDAAVTLLAEHNGSARPLAGGTDLIDHVRTARLSPDLLIDVKQLPELNILQVDDDGLRLGAAVPCHRIIKNEAVSEQFSAIVDASSIIGGVQIQSRASVGGNLCNSGPAADSIPALIALEATCVIAGPSGQREVPITEFCTGPGTNVLQTGELLVELRMPPQPARSGSHYRRFIPRNEMDIAVVGVGASITLDDDGTTVSAARIALGAVAPTPLLAGDAAEALIGKLINDETLAAAAEAARGIVSPIDDMRGTVAYRRHVTGVLVQRAIRSAAERANGPSPVVRRPL